MPGRGEKRFEEKRALHFGVYLTVGVHLLLVFILAFSGFEKIFPPPVENGIVIDYSQYVPEPKPIEVKSGSEPRSENPKPEDEIRLVQRSKSAIVGKSPNKGAESTMGNKGDVDKFEAQRKKVIDRRALFPSENNGDSTAPQVASKISKSLSAGHPDGNTEVGSTEGVPSARLAGRSLMGNLPEPEYLVNKSGKVVVKIMVDQYGKVVNAIPGVSGTTVQDRVLWNAAKEAALKARFNISSSAPGVQEGTITYIFKLK